MKHIATLQLALACAVGGCSARPATFEANSISTAASKQQMLVSEVIDELNEWGNEGHSQDVETIVIAFQHSSADPFVAWWRSDPSGDRVPICSFATESEVARSNYASVFVAMNHEHINNNVALPRVLKFYWLQGEWRKVPFVYYTEDR